MPGARKSWRLYERVFERGRLARDGFIVGAHERLAANSRRRWPSACYTTLHAPDDVCEFMEFSAFGEFSAQGAFDVSGGVRCVWGRRRG